MGFSAYFSNMLGTEHPVRHSRENGNPFGRRY